MPILRLVMSSFEKIYIFNYIVIIIFVKRKGKNMRIKYRLLEKLINLTRAEMDLFLYIATKQDLSGFVPGVHNQDVVRNTGMCKQSFYTSMRGLERKGVIRIFRATNIDYDITILDNDFSYEGAFHEGYVNLQRKVFHTKRFRSLKAREKFMLMYFLKITHENSSSYRIGTRTFYDKFVSVFQVTKRVVRYYLHALRDFFSIGIKNGIYYITYRHSVFQSVIDTGTEEMEHENFIRVCCRRNKIQSAADTQISDTAGLIKQYRREAKRQGYDIYEILKLAIRQAAQEKEKPKDRILNPKYIHLLTRNMLAF